MYVYAGIDEAGYGPMFGPLLVGRAVLELDAPMAIHEDPPDLWKLLERSVCKRLSGARGRIAVNDSKKLRTKAAGISHLERGVLAFASLNGIQPHDVGQWLDAIGETRHRHLDDLPWYAPTADWPWDELPTSITPGELAVSRNMLQSDAHAVELKVLDIGASVVFEDVFNRMVNATRSKASTSFTFVAGHLRSVWDSYGQHGPLAAVDRQSGRQHYRDLLGPVFPDAQMTVLVESPEQSAYQLTGKDKSMTIRFEVDSESNHMPVALASMICKYTRELMMNRFNAWFNRALPDIAPTAGYATDGKRFLDEIRPSLDQLGVDENMLIRVS